jgi:hypothetical protein
MRSTADQSTEIPTKIVWDQDSVLRSLRHPTGFYRLPGAYGKILGRKMQLIAQMSVAFGAGQASVNQFGGFQAIFEPTM